jgi:hypothetical protein
MHDENIKKYMLNIYRCPITYILYVYVYIYVYWNIIPGQLERRNWKLSLTNPSHRT